MTKRRLSLILLVTLAVAGKAAQYGDFTYKLAVSAITITGYTGPGGAVTIPSTIDDHPVTCIGISAFVSRKDLTSVTIPDSVTTIKAWAFCFCDHLTNATLGKAVASIESWAFAHCERLPSVTIPQTVTTIDSFAFADCTNLAAVRFQGNAPSASPSAFHGDYNATVYYLPGTTNWGPAFANRPTAEWKP
jgi:hypothetical protein